MRNLYNDNIKDVFSIEDLETLKENGYMNVLANQDDYIMIEAGYDFWKIDIQSGEVTQYRDFVSLQNDIEGELVYSRDYPALNKDYGAVLYDTVISSGCDKLPKFSLQERKDYMEDTVDGLVQHRMKGQFEQSLKVNRKDTKEISSNLTESVNKPETKFMSDSIQIATDIMSIVFTFVKNRVDKNRREKFINDVMDKLDKNEMSPTDVKMLMKEYPELEKLLYQWQKGKMKMNVETSTTIDKALENVQKEQKNNQEVKEPTTLQIEQGEPKPLQIEQGGEIKEEKKEIENTNTTSQKKEIEIHFDEFLEETDEQMSQTYGIDFKKKMQYSFKKSGETDSLEYCFNLLDEKTLDDLKTDYPDINKDDCTQAIAYINHLIDDESTASKKLLMDKLSNDGLTKGYSFSKVVTNIINQMISKVQELAQQHQKNQAV